MAGEAEIGSLDVAGFADAGADLLGQGVAEVLAGGVSVLWIVTNSRGWRNRIQQFEIPSAPWTRSPSDGTAPGRDGTGTGRFPPTNPRLPMMPDGPVKNRVYGMMLPDTDFTLDDAMEKLRARFPDFQVTRTGDQITVASSDWEIELALNDGPEVAEDSVHIAEKIAGDDAGDLAAVSTRVEVWSDTPDYEMAHFADFLGVVDVLKTFTGMVVVNPEEPGLM